MGVRGYVPREAEFGSRNRVGGAQLRSELGLLNPQLGCGASELGPDSDWRGPSSDHPEPNSAVSDLLQLANGLLLGALRARAPPA